MPTEEITATRAVAMKINSSLSTDTRYMYFNGLSYQPCEKISMISKNEFEYKVFLGTYFTKQDAFILQAVHELGYATFDSTLSWLALQKKKFPKKAILEYTKNSLSKRMQFLARQGLLAEYDYITQNKMVEHVFVCHSYGHLYFRNQLDCFSLYDQSALCRTEIEIFKRLASNVVSLAFANYPNTKGISVNNRSVSNKTDNGIGYIYGLINCELEDKKMNYVVEPVYFSYDPQISTEEEWMDKLENRLNSLVTSVNKLNEDIPTKVIFCFENKKGISKFTEMISTRDLEFFKNCLYTSENVVNRSNGDLSQCFLSLRYSDEKPQFRPVLKHWTFEKKEVMQ